MRLGPSLLLVALPAFLAGCATASAPADTPRQSVTNSPAQPSPSSAGVQLALERPLDPPPPDTFDISRLESRPVVRFQARPQYPFALRKQGAAGEAVVDFIVDKNGDVQRAFAVRCTHPEFGVAAVAAVSQWRFKPGMMGGRVVNTHMQVPIVFTLNQR